MALKELFGRKYPFTLAPIEQNGRMFYIRAKFKLTEEQIKLIISTAEYSTKYPKCYITIKGKEAPENRYASIDFDCDEEPFT